MSYTGEDWLDADITARRSPVELNARAQTAKAEHSSEAFHFIPWILVKHNNQNSCGGKESQALLGIGFFNDRQV
jgi:hypothetical protein